MGINRWWNLDSGRETIRLGGRHERSNCNCSNKQAHEKWQMFWRKMKREKRKFLSSRVRLQTSYDPNTYLKNFDQGTGWMEPDNLHRSFSARFADPSKVFRMTSLLD